MFGKVTFFSFHSNRKLIKKKKKKAESLPQFFSEGHWNSILLKIVIQSQNVFD